LSRLIVALATLGIVLCVTCPAEAQQKTLYLDRLTVGGAPDDGIAVWRPYEAPKTRAFAQMGLGLTLRPLRVRTVTTDANPRLRDYNNAVVGSQFIDYATVGTEIAGRAAILLTLPFTLFQSGSDPSPVGGRGVGSREPFACEWSRVAVRGTVH